MMDDQTDSQAVYRLSSGPRTFFRLPYCNFENMGTSSKTDIALIGVPIDGATGYRSGARFGPEAVRVASTLARMGSRERELVVNDVLNIVDGGDIHVVPGYHLQTLELIEVALGKVHNAEATPVIVGGDHSLAIAELRAAAAIHGPLSLVQFDAHRDVLDDYFGVKHFHGTVYRRGVEEGLIDVDKSIQIGMRGSVPPEDLSTDDLGLRYISADEAMEMGPSAVANLIADTVKDGPTSISFDIDYVDPAYAPGTGTPEVGGPSSAFALRTLREMRPLKLATASLVEISPPYDHADITAHLGVAVLFELLALVAQSRLD